MTKEDKLRRQLKERHELCGETGHCDCQDFLFNLLLALLD